MTEPTSGAKAPAPRREALGWIPAFLAELAASGSVHRAILASGVARQTPYDTRRRHPDFAAEWDKALAAGLAKKGEARVPFAAMLPDSPPEIAGEEPAD